MPKKILEAATAAMLASVAIPPLPAESSPYTLSQTLEFLAAAKVTPSDFGLVKPQYTVRETLSLLGIGRNTLYGLIKTGELVPVKFGKKTLLTAPDLARVILMRRAGASLPVRAQKAAAALEVGA
jgi:excisionase family DNA binding protein